MTKLYGIKNCDTVKKARVWLDQQNIDYQFHDFRADGVTLQQAQVWVETLGEALINRRSTTWKQLSADQQTSAVSAPAQLVVEFPTLIKRPLLETQSELFCGFKPDQYATIFS